MRANLVLVTAILALLGSATFSSPAQAASCCEGSFFPGCDDAGVMFCVCTFDSHCCTDMWDIFCIAEVDAFGCGKCGCKPACAGKVCGDNGCGGVCGQCPGGLACQDGACVSQCTPSCTGKVCGEDGCGGTCGTCLGNSKCVNGACESSACVPTCDGKQCGPDGCGGSCGVCPQGAECADGICKSTCEPLCVNKECGANGCGGYCGLCLADQVCTATGVCIPEDEAEGIPLDPSETGSGDAADDGTTPSQNWEEGEEPGSAAGDEDVWEDDSWEGELWTEASASAGGPCPLGKVRKFGRCVSAAAEDGGDDGALAGGCSAGSRQSSSRSGLGVLLALGILLLAARCRRFLPLK